MYGTMTVTHNLLAMNAGRTLGVNTKTRAKSTEKLSSGYKINRSADDAAGLAISEKMRRQVRGLHQGAENIQDGISYVQTADGALEEAQSILQRINELSVQAANGTNDDGDRAAIDQEVQALKVELTRIFGTTTFNERKIWDPDEMKGTSSGAAGTSSTVGDIDPNRELIGYKKEQAVTFQNTSKWVDVTNDNCGVIALGGYQIHADKGNGVYVSWMGYDGERYQTETISWDELKKNNYRFNMADYFGDKTDNKLYDVNGDPVFEYEIAFAVHEKATIDDIIKCIDGRTISSSAYADMDGQFEDKDRGTINYDDVYIYSVSLSYSAAYASNANRGQDSSTSNNIHDFDNADDAFLEPRDADGKDVQNPDAVSGGNLTRKPGASSVEEARNSSEGWEFSFYMDGIGKVTASSSYVSYYAPSDTADDDYGYWWRWVSGYRDGKYVEHLYKSSISRSVDGTLGGVMDALTGRKGETTPGLLAYGNGGDANGGGYIDIHFNLTSENSYEYGENYTSNNVGSMTIRINVTNQDTEETVLEKIQNALNGDTILDFSTSSGSSYYGEGYLGTASANAHYIETPLYRDEVPDDEVDDNPIVIADDVRRCNFFVQAGAEAGQHIDIEYDALNLRSLGLQFTNVTTVKDASRSINSAKRALSIISDQRSTFGAYQNRLEHAYNINLNTEENTQSAESVIRDTDVASEMLKNSNLNILMQAGVSMLSQANQQPNYALSLLQ